MNSLLSSSSAPSAPSWSSTLYSWFPVDHVIPKSVYSVPQYLVSLVGPGLALNQRLRGGAPMGFWKSLTLSIGTGIMGSVMRSVQYLWIKGESILPTLQNRGFTAILPPSSGTRTDFYQAASSSFYSSGCKAESAVNTLSDQCTKLSDYFSNKMAGFTLVNSGLSEDALNQVLQLGLKEEEVNKLMKELTLKKAGLLGATHNYNSAKAFNEFLQHLKEGTATLGEAENHVRFAADPVDVSGGLGARNTAAAQQAAYARANDVATEVHSVREAVFFDGQGNTRAALRTVSFGRASGQLPGFTSVAAQADEAARAALQKEGLKKYAIGELQKMLANDSGNTLLERLKNHLDLTGQQSFDDILEMMNTQPNDANRVVDFFLELEKTKEMDLYNKVLQSQLQVESLEPQLTQLNSERDLMSSKMSRVKELERFSLTTPDDPADNQDLQKIKKALLSRNKYENPPAPKEVAPSMWQTYKKKRLDKVYPVLDIALLALQISSFLSGQKEHNERVTQLEKTYGKK